MTDNGARPGNLSADLLLISPGAAAILRGTQRLLRDHGFVSLSELPLASGRRADIIAIGPKSVIWIVEIKSSIADFRGDQKWPEHRDDCDAMLFAVALDFPASFLPTDVGLIFADAYGGEIIRQAPAHPLTTARRKSLILSFATTAARGLHALRYPPEPMI